MSEVKAPSQTFGQRVRALRELEGMTQIELGQRVGRGAKMIAAIEVGQRHATADEVDKWAAALNVTPAMLFGGPFEYRDGFVDGWRAAMQKVRRLTEDKGELDVAAERQAEGAK